MRTFKYLAMALLIGIFAGPALVFGQAKSQNGSTTAAAAFGDTTVSGHLSAGDAGFRNVSANSYTATEPTGTSYLGSPTSTPGIGALFLGTSLRTTAAATLVSEGSYTVLNSVSGPTYLRAANGTLTVLGSGVYSPESTGGVSLGSSSLPWGAGFMLNNGPAISLIGTTSVYQSFYPDGFATGRKGYLGFATTPNLELANEYLNGPIIFKTNNAGSNGERGRFTQDGSLRLTPKAALEAAATAGEGSLQVLDSDNSLYYSDGTTNTKVVSGLTATATLDFALIAAGGFDDKTVALTGAAAGKACSVGGPTVRVAGVNFDCWVSATDVVSIRAACNNGTAGTCDPASDTYRVTLIQ